MKHVAFFGDSERTFALPPELIAILERKTGVGIGALCQRVFDNKFALADIVETIRFGLIGGDTPPLEADALVAAFVAKRPFAETFPIAVAILEIVWFGSITKLDPPT